MKRAVNYIAIEYDRSPRERLISVPENQIRISVPAMVMISNDSSPMVPPLYDNSRMWDELAQARYGVEHRTL